MHKQFFVVFVLFFCSCSHRYLRKEDLPKEVEFYENDKIKTVEFEPLWKDDLPPKGRHVGRRKKSVKVIGQIGSTYYVGHIDDFGYAFASSEEFELPKNAQEMKVEKYERIFTECLSGDCKNGSGKATNHTGDMFEGAFHNRRPRQGTLIYNLDFSQRYVSDLKCVGRHMGPYIFFPEILFFDERLSEQPVQIGGGFLCIHEFKGSLSNGIPETGKVKAYQTNDHYYEGKIENFSGEPTFSGTGVYSDGDYKYNGAFKGIYAHGAGTLTYKTHEIIVTGTWNNGKLKSGKIYRKQRSTCKKVVNYAVTEGNGCTL